MNEIVEYFFSAYFHQDWRDECASSFEVVEMFAREETAELVLSLAKALKDISHREYFSQNQFSALSANFNPTLEGMSVEEWLIKAQGILVER